MDLRKEWQQLHQQKFNYSPIEKEEIMTAIYQESSSTIATLTTRLKWKLYWIILFIVLGIVWMLFSVGQPELLLIQGVFLGAYLLGLIAMGFSYQKMKKGVSVTGQTLSFLKKQHQLIQQALNIEKFWGFVFFPIAIIGGMLTSYYYKGRVLAEVIQDTKFLMIALTLVIVFVPILNYVTNKMNQHAYGQLLEDLQNNIRRMEDLA